MRKVIFGINMTTDGYCSHEDGIADEEIHDFFTRMLHNVDVLLYGRTTYQLMVPYWPEVARKQDEPPAVNEFARVFNALEKVVFSRTLKQVEDAHSRLATRDLVEEVTELKKQPGKDIAAGSLSIASQLSAHGLIDEYHFVVHPVIAGKGPRLFETVKLKERMMLELVGTKTFQSGAIALHYTKR